MVSPYIRQRLIFDPGAHRDALGKVALVGCGAIGSAMALALVKMGVSAFDLWDHDVVAPHNIPNQALFAPGHRGRPKVAVAARQLRRLCGRAVSVLPCPTRFLPWRVVDYDTLILAVDSLETRASVWRRVKASERPDRFLDLRLGNQTACAYALTRPFVPEHVAAYERLLVAAEPDVCGAQSFIGSALLAAALGSMTLAAWGRGESTPWEAYLSFDCSSSPFFLSGA